ncbi:anhydro-N-acetylmuramic acid kinase [Paludibacterium paludis]|uniref:Anhydro-N-acetylmuramic acid kinase n=1 Tax=Paludibacterium paludis TaxID=1225769 RepID=A0A918UAJ9_9NEIS|nr:anhydro-N-acetylmuramic acid kinase [Paludibacterium paludis]GGY22450.1 anhydro-N-acetylmuramic acid kinase [Paludibacterium paludis]
MSGFFIGLMSGTSLDGVDAVLVDIAENGALSVRHEVSLPYDEALRADILSLQPSGPDELDRANRLANRLARLYARAAEALLASSPLPKARIRAIGCHGQTVRHAPHHGYTIQLCNLALLAELTGIDVIGDFRSRDIAAGGQGAPLVPAFHEAVFGHPGEARAILNLGGIANWSLLVPGKAPGGFDCGPANMLMDAWIHRHQGVEYDEDGAWAASGVVHEPLLARLLSDPFFRLSPPKSTGRELFDLPWLDTHLARLPAIAPVDVQATLCELTARSAAQALRDAAPQTRAVYLCGGGARNGHLRSRIAALLDNIAVATTDEIGMPAHQVEAAAFAWLAARCLERLPGNLPSVTGAAGPRVLGAIHPA